jgi:NAD(P)-dependent dehydrogenase (short-subunit alcohol dehydrogenase family)
MEKLLEDKVIVIVGGAGLLGKIFCSALAEQGANLIVADINEAVARKAILDILDKSHDSKLEYANVDITSCESIQMMIRNTARKNGKIHAVVNTAYPRNKNYGKKFEEVSYEDFCDNVNIHLGGYFLVAQQFALFFKQQGSGNIINIASIYGVIPPKFEIYNATDMTMPVEYAAIKSANIHLTKYIAKYCRGWNIRVNSISPGGIFNGQTDTFVKQYNVHGLTKGLLNGNDIVGALLFLLSDMSNYVNGQNIVVDDGFTL